MTTPTCSTCILFDRQCGCCRLTGDPRKPDSAACMEHTDGKMDSERKPQTGAKHHE